MFNWEDILLTVQITSFFIAIINHSILINLIINHSPKDIGAYKYLMLLISIFEVIYAVLDLTVQPIFHSFGATFTLIVNTTNSGLDKSVWEILAVVYCGFYGSSMAIFSIHYAYRYWVLIGKERNLSWFKGRKVLFWLIIPFSIGLIWAVVGYFPCYPRASTNDYLRESVQMKLGLNIDRIVYFAPYFYEKNEFGQNVIYWPSFVGIMLDSLSINLSLLVVGYYGVKCWNKMSRLLSTTSIDHQNIQNQLFYSLVAQTVIPIFLMHIPALTMFMFSFLEMDAGHLSGFVSMSIAMFPALDPIPTILIISNYRDAIKRFVLIRYQKLGKTKLCRCLIFKKKSIQPSVSSSNVL
ncbi:hypothetical protein GCK72_019354 [Caenorhabditis remanei]|uniref:Serpentine receptor class r-10 n=1 Tax=Caenorhabditis remanei TaxID=31234 RepID=A0A6A5GED4_CAERE|nr:hypothetical protein GCK72_019354 [Caenorhabditis remanei]KAF1752799.1 hypothetical protein GCK72_019354 [Caenorhabditis remanei]